MINKINIADYTRTPGPRYKSQGDGSGEEFYETVLEPKFYEVLAMGDGKLEIVLDGTFGYASSFLDEAFGRLVYQFSESTVRNFVSIISKDEPEWAEMLLHETFPQWEKRRKSGASPKETNKQ